MKRRILVPLDGMPLAETALPTSCVLGGVLDADLELLQVLPSEIDSAVDRESRAQTYLASIEWGLAGARPAIATTVLHGEPGRCIVREAADERIALVVMTTHARSGLRRAVLGSVAEYVIAHSPAPTVLTRAGTPPIRGLRTLLVAIGATSAAPVPTIVELAGDPAVRVVLLRVVAAEDLSIWQWQRGPALDEPQLVLTARQQLEDIAIRLRAEGIRTEAQVAVGDVVSVIDRIAQRVSADLIVMDSHARTGAQRAVRGSVSDAVMRTARCPVMVCRLVPPPPQMPDAHAVARAVQHLPPPLVPQTIPEPPDGVRHTHASAAWRHLSGSTSH